MVVVIFFAFVIRFVIGYHERGMDSFTEPFYNPATFSFAGVGRGTSIAVLTYIGFDGISTFSEEVENPRRNIMLATVGVCLLVGVLAPWKFTRRNWFGAQSHFLKISGVRVSTGCPASRRIFSVSPSELHGIDCQHRLRHGFAIGRRPASLRYGTQ